MTPIAKTIMRPSLLVVRRAGLGPWLALRRLASISVCQIARRAGPDAGLRRPLLCGDQKTFGR